MECKIKKIEHFCLNEHYANIYKLEGTSTMALIREQVSKLNELIDSFNELSKEKWEKIHEQDGKIHKAIIYMKDNLLNSINDLLNSKGDQMLDNAVKEYLGELKQDLNVLTSRLNNLLGSVQAGSTTLDSEIIDARVGEDNVKYTNLGEAIRKQFSYAPLWRSIVEYDADKCTKVGHYFVGSGDGWKNIPGSVPAGVLITYNGGTNSRIYQQFQNYYSQVYYRNMKNGVWDKWVSAGESEDSFRYKTGTLGLQDSDLNNILEMGSYRLGSGYTYKNSPAIAGVLIVFNVGSPNQCYQMIINHLNEVYTRGFINGYWTEWSQLARANSDVIDPTITESKNYVVSRESSEVLNIYKKGANGYIKYKFGKHVDSSINLNTYRLLTIDLCDNSKNTLKAISTIGFDNEGVVLLDGDSDHLGGVHGDEVASSYYLFVDGKQYTLDTIHDLDCNEVKIIVNSTIYNQDSSNKAMSRSKHITFDKDGVHIKNKWTCLKDLSITSIRSCMLSINKDCFTHIYDSNVNTSPILKTQVSELYADKNIVDLYYVGDISAHHYAGSRGGSKDNYSTIIQDYGTRIKSYFNCYDGYKAKTNESLTAESHFDINC